MADFSASYQRGDVGESLPVVSSGIQSNLYLAQTDVAHARVGHVPFRGFHLLFTWCIYSSVVGVFFGVYLCDAEGWI